MTFRTSPDRFAKEFNEVVPGAYRRITSDDVRDMYDCGLIGKYYSFGHKDIETVRAILRYEELRQKRIEKPPPNSISDIRTCRLCGIILPADPIGKYGRPKEYCSSCEPVRAKKRYQKWRRRRQARNTSSKYQLASGDKLFESLIKKKGERNITIGTGAPEINKKEFVI